MKYAAFIAGIAFLLTGAAFAQETTPPADCVAPTAPPKVTVSPLVEPQLPSCMDPKTHVSKCGAAVTKKFNVQVDAYNGALEKEGAAFAEYQKALRDYQIAANQYANCEIERNNKQIK